MIRRLLDVLEAVRKQHLVALAAAAEVLQLVGYKVACHVDDDGFYEGCDQNQQYSWSEVAGERINY